MKDASQSNAAPPAPNTISGQPRDSRPPASVICPFCRSTDTELLAMFGAQLSTVQYYCRACRTPFEYLKQDEA